MPFSRGYSKRRSLGSRSIRTLKRAKSSKIFFQKSKSKHKLANYTNSETKLKCSRNKCNHVTKNYSEKEAESFAGKLRITEQSSKADRLSPKSLKKDKTMSVNNFFKANRRSPVNCVIAEPNTNDLLLERRNFSDESLKFKVPTNKQSVVFISLKTLKKKKKFRRKAGIFSNHKEKKPDGKPKKTPKYQKQLMEKVQRKNIGNKSTDYYKQKNFTHRSKVNSTFKQILTIKSKETSLSEQTQGLYNEKESDTNFSQVDVNIWPCFEKENSSVESISKINKKYIESLLQLASIKKKIDYTYSKNSDLSTTGDEELKKKLSNKIIVEVKKKHSKKKKKFLDSEVQRIEYLPAISKLSSISTKPKVSCVKVLRVLTKSDNQFKRIKSKKLKKYNVGKPEIKSEKKITDLNTTDRKKRKHKNYKIQMSNKEYNKFFPNVVTNTADLKEIWRRNDRKQSENSLTSQSNCSVLENEELKGTPYLGIESYNKLKRIVQEEVLRISKNCALQRQTKEDEDVEAGKTEEKKEISAESMAKHEENQDKSQSQKENSELKTSIKSFCRRFTAPISENFKEFFDKSENLNLIVKRRIIQGKEQKSLFYDQLKKKSDEYLHTLYKDTSEEIKMKLKRLAEEKTPSTKIPSHIAKTWPLVQRLQKAFLALGTPTFQEKDINCSKVKKNNNLSDGFSKGITKKIDSTILNDSKQSQNINFDYVKSKKKPKTPNASYPEKFDDKLQNSASKKEKKLLQNFYKAENNVKPNSKPKLLMNKNSTISVNKVFDNGDASSNQKKNCQISTRENFNSLSRIKTIIKNDENVKILNPKKIDVEARYNVTTKKRLEMAKKLRDEAGDTFIKKDSLKMHPWEVFRKKTNDEKPNRQKTFEVLPKIIKPRISDSCSTVEDNTESDVKIYTCTNRDYSSEEKIQKKKYNKTHYKDNNYSYFYEDASLAEETQACSDFKNTKKSYFSKNSSFAQEKIKPRNERESLYINKGIRSIFKAKRLSENNSEKDFLKSEDIRQEYLIQKDQRKCAEKTIKQGLILSTPSDHTDDFGESGSFTKTNFKYLPPTQKLENPMEIIDIDSSEQSETSQISLQSTETRKPQNLTPQIQIIDITPPNYPSYSYQKNDDKEVKGYQPSVSIFSSRTYDNVLISPKPFAPQSDRSRSKPLWEKDIQAYRQIVKDIMNQYKRIDGLLTQGQRLENFQYYPQSGKTQIIKDLNNSIVFSDNTHSTDIQEYRKKIMSEYQKLSIFDYKSKLKMTNARSENEDLINFGGLVLVHELNSNNDVDVKDFQPNIHKVLDSQIYVDSNYLETVKGKKFSWHEIGKFQSRENRKLSKSS